MESGFLLCLIGLLLPSLASCQACSGSSDILFLIDDSDSTKRNNSADPDTVIYAPGVIAFIQQFIHSSNQDGVRMSVLAFSESCRVISSFTSNSSILTDALSTLQPEYKGTDASQCMTMANSIFETEGRLGVNQYIILLTDGSSRMASLAASQAADLEQLGIDVIAIGFGNAVPRSELLSFAKDDSQVFKVTSDTELSTLYSSIANIACPDPCSAVTGNGAGLYPYPGNCAKFFQVTPTGQCVEKDCAYTTMWNDNIKVCDFPSRSTCDPCRVRQYNGRKNPYHLYCNAYWQCNWGVSEGKCCGAGTKYVQGTGCIAAGAGECPNPCA